jgi:hypothetical protein
MSDDQENNRFTGSARIAALNAPASEADVARRVSALAKWSDRPLDSELLSHLSTGHRQVELRSIDVSLNTIRLTDPINVSWRTGRQWLAARHMFELVPDPFDETLSRPQSLTDLMRWGADGLVDSYHAQRITLCAGLRSLCDTLIQLKRPLVLLDCPRGGTVPTAALEIVLRKANVQVRRCTLLASRKQTGPQSLRSSIEALDLTLSKDDVVVYVDDAITGSRFGKIYEQLKKTFGPTQVLGFPITLVSPPDSRLVRLLAKVEEDWKTNAYVGRHFVEVAAALPLSVDGDKPLQMLFSDSPFFWIDPDFVTGARKVNFLFHFLHVWMNLEHEFADPNSKAAREIEFLWSVGTDGTQYAFSNGLVPGILNRLSQSVQWQTLSARAAKAFPRDHAGEPISPTLEAVGARWNWFVDAVRSDVAAQNGEQAGHCMANMISSLAMFREGAWGLPNSKAFRDHDFIPYVIPYCSKLREFHLRVVERISQNISLE